MYEGNPTSRIVPGVRDARRLYELSRDRREMPIVARTPQSALVVTFGFSRRNAEIAIEMAHTSALTSVEDEVIKLVLRTPQFEEYSYKQYELMNHLNYRITLAGGTARSGKL